MNLEQAKALKHRQELHYTGEGDCSWIVGKDGSIRSEYLVKVRVNGDVKTWKTDKNRVKVPIKHGLWTFGYLTEDNLEYFHLAEECPFFASPPAVDPPLTPASKDTLEETRKDIERILDGGASIVQPIKEIESTPEGWKQFEPDGPPIIVQNDTIEVRTNESIGSKIIEIPPELRSMVWVTSAWSYEPKNDEEQAKNASLIRLECPPGTAQFQDGCYPIGEFAQSSLPRGDEEGPGGDEAGVSEGSRTREVGNVEKREGSRGSTPVDKKDTNFDVPSPC